MFKKISRDDDIFLSDLFLQDALAFCIADSIRNNTERYPSPKVFSNGNNCIIINSDPNHAIVTWTADDFREKDELYDFIKSEFSANSPFKIMAKKDFYDYLVKNHKIPELKVQTLGVYTCKKLNDVAYVGHPDHAKPEEIDEVAQMLVCFGIDTGEDPDAKKENYLETAQEFVSDPKCRVWRDENEKIVAIAHIRMDERYPRVGRVCTKREERGKSYAKMLVHYLTSLAIKGGKMPMLFTDFDYLSSNRCYQAVGYELECTIVNFLPPL